MKKTFYGPNFIICQPAKKSSRAPRPSLPSGAIRKLTVVQQLDSPSCLNLLSPSCSVWEIIGQADGGLSVLRTFRLLRVLKLVRFMPALRRQLVVLMKTMDNVATFCMLLMLFIFIFR